MIAISTAFDEGMVAIDINGKRDSLILPSNCRQSENLLKSIDMLLDRNDLSIADNDSFGVVLGPGSFTGLRIGAALVKGLCAGSKKECKVVGISSLALLAKQYAAQFQPKTNFCCVLNALSGLLFFCEFDQHGKSVGEEKLVMRAQLESNKLQLVGLKGEGIANIEVALTPDGLLSEANRLLETGKTIDAKTFSPVYLRKSQAEVSLEEREKGKKV